MDNKTQITSDIIFTSLSFAVDNANLRKMTLYTLDNLLEYAFRTGLLYAEGDDYLFRKPEPPKEKPCDTQS